MNQVQIMNPWDSQGNQITDSRSDSYHTVRGCGGAGYQQGYLFVFRDDITIKIDEDEVGFTLGARDFKGVQCVSYQTTTGALSPGAHPGGFNGQDAFSDMLVTENESLLNTQAVLPHNSTGGLRCESGSIGLQRPSDSNHSGGG